MSALLPPDAGDFPRTFLIRNATLISMDERRDQQLQRAAILIRDGLIEAVFEGEAEIPGELSAITSVDAGGRAVVPGLTDGHAHLDRETLGDDLPGFSGAKSYRDVLDVVSAAVARARPGEWIVTRPLGASPDYGDADDPFNGGRLPDRYDLDTVSPHNPVFIRPIWGFWNMKAKKLSFANSLALEAAGITAQTASPHDDLTIQRDSRGEPTGVFVETNQQPIIEHTLLKAAPGFDRRQRAAAISNAFVKYASYGTTAVFEGHGVAGEVLEAYLEAYEASGGPRLRACLPLSPHWPEIPELTTCLDDWRGRFEHQAGSFAGVDGVFVEGAADLSAYRLRAANHPRTGWAGFSSGATVSSDQLEEVLVQCARKKVRVCAIAGNMLEVMARVHRRVPINGLRWTLGHQPTFNAEEIDRAAEMGLIITTITGHLLRRGVYTRQLIGTERENEIVPVKSLTEAGIPVILGSDNRPISIWDSFYHVVSREDELGTIVAPDQAVSRYEALKLATVNGAILTGDEGIRGVIRPGYVADLAILDRNPLECDLDELSGTRSVATFVAGRPVSLDETLVA